MNTNAKIPSNVKLNLHFGFGNFTCGAVIPMLSKLSKGESNVNIIISRENNKKWDSPLNCSQRTLDLYVDNKDIIGSYTLCIMKPNESLNKFIWNNYVKGTIGIIMTNELSLIQECLQLADRVFTSLKDGLCSLEKYFSGVDINKEVPIYCLENNYKLVESMRDSLSKINSYLNVYPVVVHRLVPRVEFEGDNIIAHVANTCTYYFPPKAPLNKEIEPEPFWMSDIRIYFCKSNQEFEYRKMSKQMGINGIHTLLAISAYRRIIKKHPNSNLGSYNLIDYITEEDIHKSLMVAVIFFGYIGSKMGLKVMAQMYRNEHDYNLAFCQDVSDQIKTFINDINSKPDTLSRVLNISDKSVIRSKYERYIEPIIDCLQEIDVGFLKTNPIVRTLIKEFKLNKYEIKYIHNTAYEYIKDFIKVITI